MESNGYQPKSSGYLQGGGRKQYKPKHGVMLSDRTRIKRLPDFDPNKKYTNRELLQMAEKILIEDPKPVDQKPAILLASHLLDRAKREIYVGNGTPDPSVASGLYWRTHPNGRKVIKGSRDRASFYR